MPLASAQSAREPDAKGDVKIEHLVIIHFGQSQCMIYAEFMRLSLNEGALGSTIDIA